MRKYIVLFILLTPMVTLGGAGEHTELVKKLSALYDDLDYEAGLRLTETAWKREGKNREELLEILKWQALFLSALNRPAEDVYLKILCLQPDFQPPVNLSPKMRQPFERAKSKAPRPLQIGLLAPQETILERSVDFQFEKTDDCGWAQELKIYLRFQEKGEYEVFKISISMVTQKRISVALKNWPLSPAKAIYWYAVATDENRSLLWQEAAQQQPNVILVRDPMEATKTDPLVAKPVQPDLAKPWYKRWWVWAIAGAALAAAGTTTAVLATGGLGDGAIDIPCSFSVAQ